MYSGSQRKRRRILLFRLLEIIKCRIGLSPGGVDMKELFCFPCNLPFKNRGEHLKFIGKDTWQELKLPESDQISKIDEIEPNLAIEDREEGV